MCYVLCVSSSQYYISLCVTTIGANLLVLHEDVAEDAVEHCVNEVGEAEVEYEDVGDGPHPLVACD